MILYLSYKPMLTGISRLLICAKCSKRFEGIIIHTNHLLWLLASVFSRPKVRKRRTAATESEMTPEVEDLIRRANNAYFERNIPLAISLLEEVIQKAPGLHDPFHLLVS